MSHHPIIAMRIHTLPVSASSSIYARPVFDFANAVHITSVEIEKGDLKTQLIL